MTLERTILWMPRILGLLFALFVSLFALDVFGAGYGFWESILGFVIHQIPVWVMLIGLALAWRWQWVGALVFGGLAVWYLSMAWGDNEWVIYAVFVVPALLVGLLFLLSWRTHAHQPA